MEQQAEPLPHPSNRKKCIIIILIIILMMIFVIIISLIEIRILFKAWHQQTIAKHINSFIQKQLSLRIGIATIDLPTGTTADFGSVQPFNGASTTKLLVGVCFLHEVEKGERHMDQKLGSFPASYQLQQMVQQSNNDAWQLLTDAIGLQTLQAYATSIGVSYNTKNNTITPENEARFLQKLYNGVLLNPHDTSLLLSFMQNTNDEDLIPSGVSNKATVYHKYGWLDGDVHDAAILIYNNHPIVVTIYTHGEKSNDYQERIKVFNTLIDYLFQYQYKT